MLCCISCGRRTNIKPVGRNTGVPSNYSNSGNSYSSSHNSIPTPPPNHTPTTPKNSNKNTGAILSGPEIFKRYNSAVFMVFAYGNYSGSQGSGFFIRPDGTAVSNYHVMKGYYSDNVTIVLSDGRKYGISQIIAKSEADDIIIFKVDGQGTTFQWIPVANQRPEIGETVYALGSPQSMQNTFNTGMVSQYREDNYIQIDVAIDHGSSGGALINNRGQAVGITTAKIENNSAQLNFAKDINLLRKYINL